MRENVHTPRRRLEENLLPTHDGQELLTSMIRAVGVRETARRLARSASAIRHWHSGRLRVPEVVRQWLLTAATNCRHSGNLEAVGWFYPRPRPIAREQHKVRQAEIRSILEQMSRQEWQDTMMEELDPYA